MEKKQAKIGLKNCDRCQRVVKSVLYQTGNYYDHYICLEGLEGEEFHVFKVKTRNLVRMEAMESAFGPAATTAITYGLMHMSASNRHPHDAPGDPPNPQDNPVAVSSAGIDSTTGMDTIYPDGTGTHIFSGEHIDQGSDWLSHIHDFLSNLDIIT